MKSEMKYYIFIIFLTILGGFLRFYRLGNNSLWLDEGATVFFTTMPPIEYWNFLQGMGDVHPPLFYYIEKFVILFGNNEFFWRIAPAIFGTISIPVFYFIGKKLFNSEIGCIMAIFLCFSPFNIYYSQDARMYSMLLFLSSVSFLLFLYAINSKETKYWILFAVFSAASIWTHFLAILFIAPLVVYTIFMMYSRKEFQKFVIISLILLFLFCLPLIKIILNLFQTRLFQSHLAGLTWGYSGVDYIVNVLISLTTSNPLGMLFLMLLFIIGMIMLIVTDFKKGEYLVTIFFFIFIMSLILSYMIPMVPRYIIFLFPIFFAIMAYSYLLFKNRVNPKLLIIIFSILIVLANVPELGLYYTNVSKEDWRNVSYFVETSTQINDTIIIMPEYNKLPFNYYYNSTSQSRNIYFATNSSQLDALVKYKTEENASMFIVYTDDLKFANPSEDAIGWINNHTIVEEQLFGVEIVKVNL